MKVLEKGTGQKGYSQAAVCTGAGNGGGGCGAKLLVEQGDMYKTSRSDYTGDTDHFVTFECCECKVETDIKDVPWAIQQRLHKKGHRDNDNGPK